MARQRSALRNAAEYLAVRSTITALGSLGAEVDPRAIRVLGKVMMRLDGRHRERAFEHLRHARPDLNASEVDRLVQRSFEHFMQLMAELFQLPRLLNAGNWAARVRLGNIAPALELLNAGRPLIMITGHVGNWEVIGYLLALLGYRIEAVARPLDNPLLNRWVLGIREQHGLHIITKRDATDRLLDVLDSGGAVGFIADQNAGGKGIFVPFFGRLASTYKSIALLAIRQNVPVVCGFARRLEAAYRYQVELTDVIRPEDWQHHDDPVYYITARYMHAIELMVRQAPEQYLWMHRRWRTRPRFEEQGKPMPASLRRNLESLPWLEPQDLARLETRQPPGYHVLSAATRPAAAVRS